MSLPHWVLNAYEQSRREGAVADVLLPATKHKHWTCHLSFFLSFIGLFYLNMACNTLLTFETAKKSDNPNNKQRNIDMCSSIVQAAAAVFKPFVSKSCQMAMQNLRAHLSSCLCQMTSSNLVYNLITLCTLCYYWCASLVSQVIEMTLVNFCKSVLKGSNLSCF